MEDAGDRVKAQVSTTWVPAVLTILMVWPALRGVAMPRRAGMVLSGILKVAVVGRGAKNV